MKLCHVLSLFIPTSFRVFYVQVREVCLQLLTSHPTLTFVIVVLPTLTELSVATLVQASDQVLVISSHCFH